MAETPKAIKADAKAAAKKAKEVEKKVEATVEKEAKVVADKTKTVAKKAASETKKTAKKTATAAKKTAKKTATAAKKTAKKVTAKQTITIQQGNNEVNLDDVIARVNQATNNAKGDLKLYVKPEDGKAYYVIGDLTGDVNLF